MYPEGANVTTRACDLCGWSIAWDGDRTFYYDPSECLSVCEDCVGEYLLGKP